jgi:hypothetical protein
MKLALLLLIFAPFAASADVRALAAVTDRGQLVGHWEAVMGPDDSGMATGIYRLDIASDSDSYLVAVLGEPADLRFIARMTALEVADGTVKLRFEIIDDGDPGREFAIEGYAAAEDETGAITGTLKSSRSRYYPEFARQLYFKRGSWTRDIEAISEKAEELIHAQRAKPKA